MDDGVAVKKILQDSLQSLTILLDRPDKILDGWRITYFCFDTLKGKMPMLGVLLNYYFSFNFFFHF